MNIEEANARLKKTQLTGEELEALSPLYILLDIYKDDFCKIIDTVGKEKLLDKRSHYERLLKAEDELAAKERYLKAKARLEELETEKDHLNKIVTGYRPIA